MGNKGQVNKPSLSKNFLRIARLRHTVYPIAFALLAMFIL